MKVACDEITGKHDDAGLLTAVTVPERLFPFWLKFTVRVVAAVPCPEGVKVIIQAPFTIGARLVLPDIEDEEYPHPENAAAAQTTKLNAITLTRNSVVAIRKC